MHRIEMKLNWQRLHRFKLYGAHEKFTIKLIVVHIQACGFYGHPFHAIMLFLAWNDTQQHTKCNNIDRVRGTSKYNQLSCVAQSTHTIWPVSKPFKFQLPRPFHACDLNNAGIYLGADTWYTPMQVLVLFAESDCLFEHRVERYKQFSFCITFNLKV